MWGSEAGLAVLSFRGLLVEPYKWYGDQLDARDGGELQRGLTVLGGVRHSDSCVGCALNIKTFG